MNTSSRPLRTAIKETKRLYLFRGFSGFRGFREVLVLEVLAVEMVPEVSTRNP
jgi:hypothetical protein